jgi:hypothetical protein
MRRIILTALLLSISFSANADYSVPAKTVGEFKKVCIEAAKFESTEYEGEGPLEPDSVAWCRRSITPYTMCDEASLTGFLEAFEVYKWDEEESLEAAIKFMLQDTRNEWGC